MSGEPPIAKKTKRASRDADLIKAELTARAKEILWKYENGSDKGSVSPYERRAGVLKRAVYQLAFDLFKMLPAGSDKEKILLGEFNTRRLERTSRAKRRKDMFRALMDVIATDEEVKRSDKDRIAVELGHARRHRIPVEFVVGFAYQSGGATMIEKRKGREHWWPKGQVIKWADEHESDPEE